MKYVRSNRQECSPLRGDDVSFEQLLDQPLNPGVSGDGPDGDIALSSRVRLARNLEGLPFPNRAGAEQLTAVTSRLKERAGAARMKAECAAMAASTAAAIQ